MGAAKGKLTTFRHAITGNLRLRAMAAVRVWFRAAVRVMHAQSIL